MPIEMMGRVLGESGLILWKKANGIDNTPVEPYSEQKSMSTETTFDKDTTDIEKLKNVLIAMIDTLAFDLRKARKVTACVTLKIRYSDFQTHTFQARIPYTAADHILLDKVLFKKNYSRRILIRLIGIKFSSLVSGHSQIDLFDDSEEKIKLYLAMDKIRLRYGSQAILRALAIPALPKKIAV